MPDKRNNLWRRVISGLIVAGIVAACAVAYAHESRLTRLEGHIPYIKDALQRIENRLDKGPRAP